MNIKELSVGDWVEVLIANKARVCKVEGIRWNDILRKYVVEVCNGAFRLQDYYILPIPLTPEILEKNGFVEICGDFVVTRNGFYINVEVQENRFGLEVSADGHIIIACDVEFVHQLQHAFRLAGIEKEIEV